MHLILTDACQSTQAEALFNTSGGRILFPAPTKHLRAESAGRFSEGRQAPRLPSVPPSSGKGPGRYRAGVLTRDAWGILLHGLQLHPWTCQGIHQVQGRLSMGGQVSLEMANGVRTVQQCCCLRHLLHGRPP